MERNTRLFGTLVLALVLTLSAARPGTAAVRSHDTGVAAAPRAGLFESAWNWLAAWWAGQDGGGRGLSRVWGAVGPEMDPNGKAHPAVGATADMGPEIDPNGKAHPAVGTTGDVGPDMDPNGR